MSGKRTADCAEAGVSNVWQKAYSQKFGREYWFNAATNESRWDDPAQQATASEPSTKKARFAADEAKPTQGWSKRFSKTHNREYWVNEVTQETRWEEPTGITSPGPGKKRVESNKESSAATRSEDNCSTLSSGEFVPTKLVLTSPDAIREELERERKAAAVDAPTCPREITTANLTHIVHRLRTESVEKVEDKSSSAEHPVIFRLADDDTAMITRAVQEDQILKTRLKVQLREKVSDLPSFWDVWERDPEFRRIIITAPDPNEAKWQCQKTHNYKVATTFMPMYAKAIYEHFGAKSVLDPCAGWGDRMVGAAASSGVQKYVCFDPNTCLRPGYAALMRLFGHEVTLLSAQKLEFSNGFEQYALPFEVGALQLPDNSFDLVFTSPPFFDYEMYNPRNPQYTDWIAQFYKPLFIQACRCVKPGHHFAIHVGDTSAGLIGEFLKREVQRICALKLVSRIGLHGMMSGKTRSVWVYRKAVT